MARFLDLPHELVLGVITFIPLEDLENFAQSCLRILSLAGSTLEKHRLLIRHCQRGPHLQLAVSFPKSPRKSGLYDDTRRGTLYYSDLVENGMRAQKWVTHVRPQPHGDLAQSECGLQLQDLSITSRRIPLNSHPWTNNPQDVKGFDEWYRDCEKFTLALHHCVKETEKPTNAMRKRLKQMKKIMDAHQKIGMTGDTDNGDWNDSMVKKNNKGGEDNENTKHGESSEDGQDNNLATYIMSFQ
ncbi:MAG: hypothetical protein Q9175_000253 [Cornicularia normoerica]